jgi:hypothetical protein
VTPFFISITSAAIADPAKTVMAITTTIIFFISSSFCGYLCIAQYLVDFPRNCDYLYLCFPFSGRADSRGFRVARCRKLSATHSHIAGGNTAEAMMSGQLFLERDTGFELLQARFCGGINIGKTIIGSFWYRSGTTSAVTSGV